MAFFLIQVGCQLLVPYVHIEVEPIAKSGVQKWVTFLRDDHLHFANTTNNCLECHNHKLKDVVSHSMSVSEMFDKVLLFSQTSAAEYSHKSFVKEFSELSTAHDSITAVSEICSTCTAHSSERMIKQLTHCEVYHYKG